MSTTCTTYSQLLDVLDKRESDSFNEFVGSTNSLKDTIATAVFSSVCTRRVLQLEDTKLPHDLQLMCRLDQRQESKEYKKTALDYALICDCLRSAKTLEQAEKEYRQLHTAAVGIHGDLKRGKSCFKVTYDFTLLGADNIVEACAKFKEQCNQDYKFFADVSGAGCPVAVFPKQRFPSRRVFSPTLLYG